jgi:hypothetical protein
MIRGELAQFIAQHTLNEFLASISLPEMEVFQPEETELQGRTAQLVNPRPVSTGFTMLTTPAFISRSQIISDLLTAEFSEQAANRGVELKWVGAGTFFTPNEIVPERHLAAWQLSRENLVRSSPGELARIQRESTIAEMLRLVQEIPIRTFRRQSDEPPVEVMRNLLIAYHGKLVEAYEMYQRDGRVTEDSEDLERVLVFLTRFVGRWL